MKGEIMKTKLIPVSRAMLLAVLCAAGTVPLASQAAPDHHASAVAQCQDCGTVVSNHTYQREPEHSSGLGAVGGAVVGGLLGNQVGSGNGRTLATVAGAAAGGYAGNRVERNMKAVTVTDVRVKMAKGGYRTITEEGKPRFHNGEHVRVMEGKLVKGD